MFCRRFRVPSLCCRCQVVHELLVLELLLTLLEKPSDSSIEVAVSLAKESGAFLQDVAPAAANECVSFRV